MRIGAFHPALTDVDSTAQAPLGGILEEANKVYKYVRFTGTTAIAVGDALCYVASAGATDTMTNVDKANTALGAGIALAVVPSGAVAFGFIQIKGLSAAITTVAGSVGNSLTPVGAANGALAVAAAVTNHIIGQVFDATNKLVALDYPF